MNNTEEKQIHKKKCLLSLVFLICSFWLVGMNIIYSYSKLWKGAFQLSNVNKDFKAVDTVWYNPENNYHNDAFIVSILNNKECVYNDNSPYSDYIITFSKSAVSDPKVPYLFCLNDIVFNDFTEVGYCLAYVHSTLVDHVFYERITEGKQDVPKLYVNTDGLSDADTVVFLNDEAGNIYLMSENYWNDKNR